MIRILLILSVLYFTLSISYAQEGSKDSVEVESVEKDGRVNYPKKLLVNPEFDFKLKKQKQENSPSAFIKTLISPLQLRFMI